MKPIILNVLIFILTCTLSNAQFSETAEESKNVQFFFGGSVNFSSTENSSSQIFINGFIGPSNSNGFESTTYAISPTVGTQLNKNWILGLALGLYNSHITYRNSVIESYESSSISFIAFARYIVNPKNKIKVYVNPYYDRTYFDSVYNFTTSNLNTSSLGKNTEERFTFGVSFGALYEITDWLRATTNVGGFYYSTGTILDTDSNGVENEMKLNSKGLNLQATSLSFGIEFIF